MPEMADAVAGEDQLLQPRSKRGKEGISLKYSLYSFSHRRICISFCLSFAGLKKRKTTQAGQILDPHNAEFFRARPVMQTAEALVHVQIQTPGSPRTRLGI